MNRLTATTFATALIALSLSRVASAATLGQGDITTNLRGTVFVDEAAPGGDSDLHVQENHAYVTDRNLDLNGDGDINDTPGNPGNPGNPGTPVKLTIKSLGLAVTRHPDLNDATSVMISFIYLGADQAFGGGDDVKIGSEAVEYKHVGAGEYYVHFDGDLSAEIDGKGQRFRITIVPQDKNSEVKESINLKRSDPKPLRFETEPGVKLSVSGTWTPVPATQP